MEEHTDLSQLRMQCDKMTDLPDVSLPDGYTLRTSNLEDGEYWADILNASFGGERTANDFIKEMVQHPAYRPERLFFICDRNGIPCATAGAYRDPENLDGTCGYVHYVGVKPNHQGKRLGYWISLAVLHRFSEEGCINAILCTDDYRLPAIKTYLNLGFNPLITDPSHKNRWEKVLNVLKFNRSEYKMIGNENVTLHPKCSWLPFSNNSWITKLSDNSLLSFDTDRLVNGKSGHPKISKSTDGGCTWNESWKIELAPNTTPHWLAELRVIYQTNTGTLLAIYEDIQNMHWGWDSVNFRPSKDTRLNVWACRSVDGGKTWDNFTMLVDGWCGALIDIKQLYNGTIAATVMDMLYNEGRHVCFTYLSKDDGLTWQKGNILDLGGRGDHDGAMEPTFIELMSGKYYMLVRTNLDFFWEAISEDCLNWRTMRQSNIDASSSPGFLLRLSSGRIALVWNRLCLEGESNPPRSPGKDNLCERPASWQRSELSIAFSKDECNSWTKPVVLAKNAAGQIAYPYLLEYEPGDLWVITRAPAGGFINFRLNETQF